MISMILYLFVCLLVYFDVDHFFLSFFCHLFLLVGGELLYSIVVVFVIH